MTTEWNAEEIREAGFGNGANDADSLELSHPPLGQSCPRHYPHRSEALGEPMTIREVARTLGCSVWTVRHAYLPQGLPHFRSGPGAKLVFFHNQVVQWILSRQQKGGI